MATLLVAIVAAAATIYAAYVSLQARNESRAVAGWALHPDVRFRAQLEAQNGVPPNFVLSNFGAAAAVQVEVQGIAHRLHRASGSGLVSMALYGTTELQRLPRLEPGSEAPFPIDEFWLDVNARLEQPLEHNVIEFRITYRVPPDLHEEVVYALYLINPQGRWVAENDPSLAGEVYDAIKSAIADRSRRVDVDYLGSHGDPLHRREPHAND